MLVYMYIILFILSVWILYAERVFFTYIEYHRAHRSSIWAHMGNLEKHQQQKNSVNTAIMEGNTNRSEALRAEATSTTFRGTK